MTDFADFVFASIFIGGSMLALAWVTVDNLKREFRDDDSLSSPAPVTPCDTNQQGE